MLHRISETAGPLQTQLGAVQWTALIVGVLALISAVTEALVQTRAANAAWRRDQLATRYVVLNAAAYDL